MSAGGRAVARGRGGGSSGALKATEDGAGGVPAAHAVNASAGRRGTGTEEKAGIGRGVGIEAGERAEEELREVVLAAGHVAADHGGIVGFQLLRAARVAGEDAIAEAGGEAFDLGLDARGHVDGAAVGNVAVGPAGVASGGSAGGIDQRLLGDEDERLSGRAAVHHFRFGATDVVEASADVDGGGGAAGFVAPGDGLAQGPVDFEDGGAVAELEEAFAEGGGEFVAGDARELVRAEVADDGAGAGEFAQVGDVALRFDRAAVVGEGANEGGDDLLGAAAGAGPVDGVGDGGEDEAEGGGAGAVERHDGVGGATGEERAGGVGMKARAGDLFARAKAEEAEARGREEVTRLKVPDGAQKRADEVFLGEGAEESGPSAGIGAEAVGGVFERAMKDGGAALGERMGEGVLRPGPFESETLEVEFAKHGRKDAHGVNGGAGVVDEPGQGEFGGAAAAAGGGGCFDDVDGQAGAREHDGGGEAVGAAADDDDVRRGRGGSGLHRRIHQASSRIGTGRSIAAGSLTRGVAG